MSRVHPLWGRPLEQYIDSFKIEASQKRVQRRDDPELEAARLEAASITLKFHDLANECESIGAHKLEDYITLPMLRTLHKLSCSPITLVDLAHVAHIGGCIRLMRATTRSAQQPGQPTLFSYEYGYLCFRIMTISMGVCLLQRLDQLNETVAEMLLDSSADLTTILSRRVSELIQSEVRGSKNERYFDRILGWARLENHPAREVFATRSDLWTLLNLLYDDRKQFLAVCSSTYSLGLSGLMFVLWRYHRFDCAVNSSNSHTSKEFIPLFGDVLLRYLLIAPTDQFKPLTIIYEQMGAMARLGGAKFLDLEDSKFVFSVCITRLAPSDPRHYAPLPVSAVGVFLYQCLPFLKPGCEHVLPSLFQKVIQRLWEAFLDEEMEGSLLVDSIKDGFQFLCGYLELFGPRTALNQDVLSQIVEEIVNNDFVDLALRVMFTLDMDVDKDSIEFGVNQQYQGHVVDFLQTLGRVVPPRLLRTAFKDIVPDLAKYSAYMRWHRLMGLAIGEKGLIMGSNICFDSILTSLQQASNLREFEKPAGLCDYSRCPHPVAAIYACGICTIRLYCGVKCQNADWCKVPSSSHRGLCPGDIKNLDPLRILDSLKDHVVAMDVTGVPVDLRTILL